MTLGKVPRIDTLRNKLLEIKPKQVVNNRVINRALIESLRSGENLSSIAHFNEKKNNSKGQNSI